MQMILFCFCLFLHQITRKYAAICCLVYYCTFIFIVYVVQVKHNAIAGFIIYELRNPLKINHEIKSAYIPLIKIYFWGY